MKKTLLFAHHAPSENLQRMKESIEQSIVNSDVTLKSRACFNAQPDDIISSQGILLMTPENLGYMSGAMKDFFDRCYYPCLELTQGLPMCAVIRAGRDGTGTRRGIETITTGLRWRWTQAPLLCRGEWHDNFLQEACELAQAFAYGIQEGIF